MTANKIGDEGARALSEMLKFNTTLTKLNVRGEGKMKRRGKKNDGRIIANEIGAEGMKAMRNIWGSRGGSLSL